jgi:hypothetical protein
MEQRSIGRSAAIELYRLEWWVGKSSKEVSIFQLTTNECCMPFDEFHRLIEEALGRPVFTHEFGLNREGLYRELIIGETERPSFEDILALIPADKRIILASSADE